MVTSNVYTATAGLTYLQDSAFQFISVLKVAREGTEFDIIYIGTPGARQVKHEPATGKLIFLNEFTEVPYENNEFTRIATRPEKVLVIIKE